MKIRNLTLIVALVLGGLYNLSALAQASLNVGSILVWPHDTSVFEEFDGGTQVIRHREETKIRIVNSGTATQSVHFVRVCHGIKNGDDKCDKLAKSFILTPNETLVLDVESVFLTNVTPNCDFGHIIAYAEQSLFSRIPVSYNYLYGDVRMNRTTGGRRMGMAPAIAIRSPLAEGSVAGAPGELAFDGAKFEQVHRNLKSTIRAGASATRNTRLYLFTFGLHAGAQNPPDLISVHAFNEAETGVSGTLEYVCSVRVDTTDVDQLQGAFLQSNFGSANGSVKLFNSSVGIGGWTVREEGNGRRSMKPLWNDGAPISTTFNDI